MMGKSLCMPHNHKIASGIPLPEQPENMDTKKQFEKGRSEMK